MTGDRARWCCEDLNEAIELAKKRNKQGIRCIIDPLGELAKDDAAADNALSAAIQTVEAISNHDLYASVALKPTALGAAYDLEECINKALKVTRMAWKEGIGVELDMEAKRYVDETLRLATDLTRIGSGPISIALQAYLFRTPMDARRMDMAGVKVRLVKGAYAGDLDDFDGITAAMIDNIDLLATMGRPFSIGTHDPRIIERIWKNRGLKGVLEVGMLKGLGDETKVKLAGKGWSIAEYVPYGKDSYAYVTRRENYLRNLGKLGLEPCP
ncbi:MAG: proline dehydrogenase family protein [Methanomassiliicoccales archaeon]